GGAPKLPHSAELDFCLRRYAVQRDASALEMVSVSLLRMAEGGIHDQLGGGFCRYSVDAEWTIPHFEKMLYDNAALLSLYADAWRATEEPRFAATARDIAGWVLAEMRSPQGGFCSSLDAARAARALDEPAWLEAAQAATDFIRRELWKEGRLLATFKDGRAHLNAYLDDHAFLLAALTELMQTSFRHRDLQWAIEIAEALLA